MKSSSPPQETRSVVLLTIPVFLVFALLCVGFLFRAQAQGRDPFVEVMNAGKSYFEGGDAEKAIAAFVKGVSLKPTHADARLNLANAYLLGGHATNAIVAANEALILEPDSPGAYFIKGCAHLRLGQFEPAIQALQQCVAFDTNVPAVHFQAGLAQQGLRNWTEAVSCFQAAAEIEPDHPAAHYNLSQVLIRQDRREEANQELILHQQIAAKSSGQSRGVSAFEKCVYTEVRVPFLLQQPDLRAIPVTFRDVTEAALGKTRNGTSFHGPVGVMDVKKDGLNDLFVMTKENSFQLLMNSNGVFTPFGEAIPGIQGGTYDRCLVGDLQNDRNEDVIVLGSKGSHVFKFATNGAITDMSLFSRLNGLSSVDGALIDLDFTGKTDLLAVTATNTVRVFRNLGNLYFKDITATSGVPSSVTTARGIVIDDWNNDDLMDVFLARTEDSPLLLLKQRGGPLVLTNAIPNLPDGKTLAVGDLNNDLQADLVVVGESGLEVVFNGFHEGGKTSIPFEETKIESLTLLDYDNDGWLDIVGSGNGLRLWRNLGDKGFKDMSEQLGLDQVSFEIKSVSAADFDGDGDTDLLLDSEQEGLKLFSNDGGNSNLQLKLRLVGNRSNASGLGIRVELSAGGLRGIRTVRQLPIEIGVGKYSKLDSLTVRWFDLPWYELDVQVEQGIIQDKIELNLPTGCCPYLYAWDGERFRFVTDLLGGSPVGLPMAEKVYIPADTDEFVWIGDDSVFKPRGDAYVLQVTEELREVLYFDEAKLVVVDHPAGTEVYPNDKLLPGKPFPPSELVTLQSVKPLLNAIRSDGLNVTDALSSVDQRMASPVNLRVPQLRGLAEPYSLTLDFGVLAADRPLALGLVGWLHFGGGTANVAASQNPDLPFPFPTLEVETDHGAWQPVDVRFGAPIGKTKRIMVDLDGKLPAESRRLRVSSAFEIHWDYAALFEKGDRAQNRVVSLAPDSADLHWRGYGEYEDLPWTLPLTPRYDAV